MRSPAVTTALACSRPGERVSRSIGPDTDTAAMTLPPWPRTGAETDADPGLALGHAGRPAPPAHLGQGRRAEPGPAQPPVQPLGLLPGQQHLRR